MKNKFFRQVSILVQGTVIAQFLPILISPLLTRLYSPEQFGVLAIYMAIISVLTPFVNARFELAISLPNSEKKAFSLFTLSFFINIFVTLVITVIVFLFGKEIIQQFSLDEANGLYLLPLGLFLTGLFSSLTYLNNRWERFNYLSKSKINQSIGMSVTQLILGFTKIGSIGLVIGYIIGHTFSITTLMKKSNLSMQVKEKNVAKSDLMGVAKEYKEFPKFAMVTHSMESFSAQTPNFLLSKFFGSSFAGFYSLTTRSLSMPLSLIGKAVGDVFLSNASKIYRENGNCKSVFIKTFKVLALLPLIPFIVLYFTAEDLFAFVFGEEWRVAGTYSKILLPAIYLQFISSPLSHMLVIGKKIKLELVIQIIILFLSLVAFIIGYFLYNSIEISLYLYSLVLIIKYLIFIMISYYLSLGKSSVIKNDY